MKIKLCSLCSVYVLFAVMLFSSCASKKNMPAEDKKDFTETVSESRRKHELFNKTCQNVLEDEYLTSKIKFVAGMADKSLSVSGILEMKKDTYLRIRLTPLGMFEAGVLEFTTDRVMVIDKVHKEYISASYAEVPFLKDNGVDFYALQSLFRNTLFVPGEKHVNAGMYKKYDIDVDGNNMILSVKKGNLTYAWLVDDAAQEIKQAQFVYSAGRSSSKLNCIYSDFQEVKGKSYPHNMSLNFTTDLTRDFKNLTMTVISKKIKTERRGDGRVLEIPVKYTKKDVHELLNKILKIK